MNEGYLELQATIEKITKILKERMRHVQIL